MNRHVPGYADAIDAAERAWRPATPPTNARAARPAKYDGIRATPTRDEVRDIAIGGHLAQLFARFGTMDYSADDLATIAATCRRVIGLCEDGGDEPHGFCGPEPIGNV